MAFVVEDGTGKPDANSYASVEFADAYFAERAVPNWMGTNEAKQGALIRATDYIESMALAWGGCQTTETQALKFPRDMWQGLPVPLQRATVLYALRALTAKLQPDPVADPTGLQVLSTKKKVDVIEKSVQYADPSSGSRVQLFRNYPEADVLLAPLVKVRRGGVIR